MNSKTRGFTIVELLIVIVIIAILAAITIVAYNGIQARARASAVLSDIDQVHRLVQLYYAEHGAYPQTGATTLVHGTSGPPARTDANCTVGSAQTDWVPGLSVSLPQSNQATRGARNMRACYMYVSDGVSYVLSAWNALESPQSSTLYRRVGFRESNMSSQFYFCNHVYIGGVTTGVYAASNDFYKYSYTYSNVASCNETPPAGA